MNAVWADDFHHSLHALLTGERDGYYADYGALWQLAKCYEQGFAYTGEYSRYRGRRHGASALGEPAERFVVCAQNHDRIGNRPFGERLKAYMVKSAREAGESTSWASPDAAYEASIIEFVDWLTMNPSARLVRKDLARYAQAIDRAALNKSLSQVVLKLATPGAPDIYQGQEARDFSFVDPDNRRPIDFAARSRVLDSLISHGESSLRLLLQSSGGERSKEFVTWRMLQLRRELPGLFKLGEYLPLKTSGYGASRVTAFARRHSDHWLIVLAPRLTYPALGRRVGPGPGPGTRPSLRLPTGCPTSWRDVLEGKGVRAAGRTLPLARTIKDGVPVVLRNV